MNVQSIKGGVITILVASIVLAGCGTCKEVQGGVIAAAAGGVTGKQAGNTAVGVIIGAALGGTAGALIGDYMDKQAEEMGRDLEGAKIERIGEGIKITFDSGILFAVNSTDLTPQAKTNVQKLAMILNNYDDANILVEGHTDASGTEEHNQGLSEQRAQSVAYFAMTQGVAGPTFSTVGYEESQPIADNATTAGRDQTRRVEIAIFAKDDLKDAAMKGELK